ncbi:unnamed protein product [Rotaria magnacalcarata]|uniref:Uncharacterized protein n=1 Tax=Rotaria magnacalcarata TaxID=392030 RepID=A0A814XM91_9BILA|nr:unnamed protein product [Rotaria magnacalcarata]CAF1923433.1 unnamed protein product [Rotaria magnacalcarata]
MNVLQIILQLIILWLTISINESVTGNKTKQEDPSSLHCHADHSMKVHYHKNEKSFKEMQRFEIRTRQLITSRRISKPYVIPVVFHAHGTNFAGHLVYDATIINALEKLNDNFHGLSTDYNTVHSVFQGN